MHTLKCIAFLAPALLRLGYYWSTGILGFKQNETKAEKKGYGRLRKIAPHLSDSDIEQMKQDLASLIGHVDYSDNTPRANAKALQSAAETKTTSENPNKTSSNMSSASINSSTETPMPAEASNVSKTRSIAAPGEAGDEIKIKKKTPKVNADLEAKPATAPDETDGKSNLGQSAPTTDMHVKLCFECKQSKRQAGYTASQWKKRIGTGRCFACFIASATINSSTETPMPAEASNVSKTRSIAAPGEAGDEIKIKKKTPKVNADLEAKPATAPDETDGKSNLGQSAPTTDMHVKLCFECKQSKRQAGYTASQWKKRIGTGRCVACVSKTVQWQTGGVGNSLQVKPCGDCSVSKPHTDFSPNQWRKVMGTGRCKECVNKSLPSGG